MSYRICDPRLKGGPRLVTYKESDTQHHIKIVEEVLHDPERADREAVRESKGVKNPIHNAYFFVGELRHTGTWPQGVGIARVFKEQYVQISRRIMCLRLDLGNLEHPNLPGREEQASLAGYAL